MIWQNFDGLAWSEPGMVQGIVFWIFLISGAVALVAWIAGFLHRAAAQPAPERALDIVRTRYAKDGIGREPCADIKRELHS